MLACELIALIPNGLDPAEIGLREPVVTPAEHWQQRPLRLLFVGRLYPVKGVDVLLKGVALALNAGIMTNLDLVGKGSPSEERRLKALSLQLGIGDIVNWHGQQPRSVLADYYCQCHLLVLPSHDELFGNVVLEAMACGRPVLGSAVGGIPYLSGESEKTMRNIGASIPARCNSHGA